MPKDCYCTFKLTHDARNRLNTVNLALVMVQKHLAAGRSADAARTLEKAHRDFLAFSAELAGEARPAESVVQRILRNALVVEDNAQEGELLAEYLRLNGFCVDTAHDGCDALDYLSTHRRPDVVLPDTVTVPRFVGWCNWRWLPRVRSTVQPSPFRILSSSRTFILLYAFSRPGQPARLARQHRCLRKGGEPQPCEKGITVRRLPPVGPPCGRNCVTPQGRESDSSCKGGGQVLHASPLAATTGHSGQPAPRIGKPSRLSER